MISFEKKIQSVLVKTVPLAPDAARDWEDVVRRSEAPDQAADPGRARRSTRSYLARRLVPAFTLAAAFIAVGLIAPWQHGRSFADSAVAERALVAIGNGPVLHVVLRRENSWSFIDLVTGQERPTTSTEEILYDSERRFLHMTENSELGPPGWKVEILQTPTGTWTSHNIDPGQPHAPSIDPALREFLDGYRSALENGDAQVAGTGAVDGHEVTWIQFAVKRACTERVAVDETSSLPIRIEQQCRKEVGISEIASIETLPSGSGDFSTPKNVPQGNQRFFVRRQTTPITLSAAVEEVPGALWLMESFSTLQLSSVSRSDLTTRETPEPGTAQSIETAIELHYGNGSPPGLWAKPPATHGDPSDGNVVLKEAARPDPGFWFNTTPPAGNMLTVCGTSSNCDGFLYKNGTYVFVHASSRALLLEAARALESIRP